LHQHTCNSTRMHTAHTRMHALTYAHMITHGSRSLSFVFCFARRPLSVPSRVVVMHFLFSPLRANTLEHSSAHCNTLQTLHNLSTNSTTTPGLCIAPTTFLVYFTRKRKPTHTHTHAHTHTHTHAHTYTHTHTHTHTHSCIYLRI